MTATIHPDIADYARRHGLNPRSTPMAGLPSGSTDGIASG
ncbi:Uncharacterised protein [Bordetella pertussis]|nr:Uncharacterised protein [Bordetella pertussis]